MCRKFARSPNWQPAAPGSRAGVVKREQIPGRTRPQLAEAKSWWPTTPARGPERKSAEPVVAASCRHRKFLADGLGKQPEQKARCRTLRQVARAKNWAAGRSG